MKKGVKPLNAGAYNSKFLFLFNNTENQNSAEMFNFCHVIEKHNLRGNKEMLCMPKEGHTTRKRQIICNNSLPFIQILYALDISPTWY